MSRVIVLLFCVIAFVYSCGTQRKLVYIDDWEGNYSLREFNSCCDDIEKPVRLSVRKAAVNKYNWKLLLLNENKIDSVMGNAIYENKKLNFYVEDISKANLFFRKSFNNGEVAFWMEYDNYYSDDEYRYINYFTRWNNELKGYGSQNKFASGIHFHFRRVGASLEKKLPK